MSALHLTLIPRISEKSYAQSKLNNTYVFTVPIKANKQQVAEAVSAQYGVTVVDVNVVISKGKAVRSVRKRSQPVKGKRIDTKKAYVRLADGSTIKMFDEETK